MKRFIIINKNGEMLHSNNCFYNFIMGGFGVNLVVYKRMKSAEKMAQKVNGIVVCIDNNTISKEVINNKLKSLSYEN